MILGLVLQALGEIKHHFVFVSDKPATRVTVAGTFNKWNKDATPMTLANDGRTWSVDVDLKPGRHYYKFVRNNDEWLTDPKAKSEDDGSGNINSLLMVMQPDFEKPARRNDGNITNSAVETAAALPYFNVDVETVTIKVRTRKNDVG